MEKAIKQRLLGGVVLVAGAALFLPILLDGSGAQLTMPPMPVAPQVPTVAAIAPKLDQSVQTADQAVNKAHEGQTFGETPAVVTPTAATPAIVAEDVAPDAAATMANPAKVAVVATATAAVAAGVVSEKTAATSKQLDAAKAAEEKLAKDKAAKAATAKLMQEKAAQEKTAGVKQVAAKVATPVVEKPVPPAEAWVVQVASLSSSDKANALVQSLRKKNYRAISHQQGNMWKVVIGPELNKEVAESIRARLAADPDFKMSGWVQAYKP
jgi:cell division septation protein DedD